MESMLRPCSPVSLSPSLQAWCMYAPPALEARSPSRLGGSANEQLRLTHKAFQAKRTGTPMCGGDRRVGLQGTIHYYYYYYYYYYCYYYYYYYY